MCRAGSVGCVLETDRLPVSRALASFCRAEGTDPVELILRGGEDYALLVAAPAGQVPSPLRPIGRFAAAAPDEAPVWLAGPAGPTSA